MPDEMRVGEQLFVGIGSNLFGQLRVIVYTYRGEAAVRAISVRHPDPSEVRAYEKGIRFFGREAGCRHSSRG